MAKPIEYRPADILRQLSALGAQSKAEWELAGRNLAELQLLQRQTATELDRLTPRSGQAAQRLRDMEAHIESYSRADIKDIYAAAQEAQMRVFMMQLQQEQIEHKQKVIAAHREVLGQVVALAANISDDDRGPQPERPQPTVSSQESISRVIQAQEEERRRVARQIHDGPAQTLANLVLRTEICERLMGSDQEQAKRELLGLRKLVTDSLQETRTFIFDLRPMILDDLGLVPTLRRYCETLTESTKVPVRLSIAASERALPPAVEIAIFRIIQEAVRNAVAHGEPTEVQVSMEGEERAVRVLVKDDGRGCDGAAVLTGAQEGRTMGITRMQQWVANVGGTLDLVSDPGRGCLVSAVVPLDQSTG